MVTLPEAQEAQFLLHSSPPTIEADSAADASPPIATKKCDAHTCPWWPYSSSKDFKTNAGLLLLIVFLAVVCALALNAAFRYILRNRRHRNGNRGLERGQPKPAPSSGEARVEEPPEVVFTPGMKLAGAEAECAICLSEFVEGEGIRVMEKCNHGFHVQCIRKWLNSRSSCPNCRTIIKPAPCSAAGEVDGCTSGNRAHRDLESGAE